MEKDHIMEKREPHDAMNLFKEVQQKILFLRNQEVILDADVAELYGCLLYTSPSPRDAHESRMPSSA